MSRALSVCWLTGLLACTPMMKKKPFDPLEGDRAYALCAQETLDLLRDGLASSNPTQRNERLHESVNSCWNLTVDVDPEAHTSVADFTRIDEEVGGEPRGCSFHGTGNELRLDLKSGGCVSPSATGYYRWALRGTSELMINTDITSVQLDLAWQETRGEDLIVGTGRVFLSVPQTPITDRKPYDARLPLDPVSACTMPTCSTANFARHGTLVKGGMGVCGELLAGYTTPLTVRFDTQGLMSIDGDASATDRPPVFGKTSCSVDTWTGSRPYPYRRVHFDRGTGALSLEETQLHQANGLADVCTVRWETTVTGC